MKPPRLDQIELAISGEPKTTPEQQRIVAAIKRRLARIKQAIKEAIR